MSSGISPPVRRVTWMPATEEGVICSSVNGPGIFLFDQLLDAAFQDQQRLYPPSGPCIALGENSAIRNALGVWTLFIATALHCDGCTPIFGDFLIIMALADCRSRKSSWRARSSSRLWRWSASGCSMF